PQTACKLRLGRLSKSQGPRLKYSKAQTWPGLARFKLATQHGNSYSLITIRSAIKWRVIQDGKDYQIVNIAFHQCLGLSTSSVDPPQGEIIFTGGFSMPWKISEDGDGAHTYEFSDAENQANSTWSSQDKLQWSYAYYEGIEGRCSVRGQE
ncbi:hypothetical protein C0995_009710, partial [Termitomyces sp. Mi166